MKKLLLCVAACLLALPVLAKDKQHRLDVAVELSDYGYREPHMEYPIHITAKKQGVSLVYTRQSVLSHDLTDDDPSFAIIELRYMDGKSDYDGYLMNGTPFKVEDEKDYYMEAALKIGARYRLMAPLSLRPYMGVGWRSLRNGSDGYITSGGVTGYTYQRTSTYIYIPLGAFLKYDMTDYLSFTLNGEFDWLIHGNQNSHVDDSWNVNSVSNPQHKGYGLRLSFKGKLDMGKFGLFVEPFWRYWKIQNSSKAWYNLLDEHGNIIVPNAGYLVEPFNITREYGIKAGITF